MPHPGHGYPQIRTTGQKRWNKRLSIPHRTATMMINVAFLRRSLIILLVIVLSVFLKIFITLSSYYYHYYS